MSGLCRLLTAELLCGAFCLSLVFTSGCGPSEASLEADMPSAEEVEISEEEMESMVADDQGEGAEDEAVDGSTDTL